MTRIGLNRIGAQYRRCPTTIRDPDVIRFSTHTRRHMTCATFFQYACCDFVLLYDTRAPSHFRVLWYSLSSIRNEPLNDWRFCQPGTGYPRWLGWRPVLLPMCGRESSPNRKSRAEKAILMKDGLTFSAEKPGALGQFAADEGRTDRRTHHEQHSHIHPGPPGQSGPSPLEQQRNVVVPLHGSPAGLYEAASARVARNAEPRIGAAAEGPRPAECDGGVSENRLEWGGTLSFPPLQA